MTVSAAAGDGRRSRSVRRRYQLKQKQFAAALGIAEKSLARLEGKETWNPALARLLLLVDRLPMAEAPKVFRALWGSAPVGKARVEPRQVDTWCREIATRARGPRGRGQPRDDRSDGEPRGAREWCYWATKARAGQRDTKGIADAHGFICRPFLDHRGEPALNLDRIAPGDSLLLLYDGEPQLWYEILPSNSGPPPGVAAIGMPHVFSFIPVERPLGQLLLKSQYTNWAGRQPEVSNDYFSCIRVKATKRRRPESPVHRPPEARGTLTPFSATT